MSATYDTATEQELEQLEQCRQHITSKIGQAGAEIDRESWLRTLRDELNKVVASGIGMCTEESLVVLVLEALGDMHPKDGDQKLAKRVQALVTSTDFKCSRNQVYRLRRRFGLAEVAQKSEASALAGPGVGPEASLKVGPDVRPERSQAGIRLPETQVEQDEFHIERPEDRVIDALADKSGQLLAILGPRGFGKTTLLNRYLRACSRNDKLLVPIDSSLIKLDNNFSSDYGLFLRFLATEMLRAIGSKEHVPDTLKTSMNMIAFVEDDVLGKTDSNMVLAIDSADYFSSADYSDDFFSMLRSWYNSSGHPQKPWARLDIALTTSIDPSMLISDPARSPFNAGEIIYLNEFTLDECKALAAKFRAAIEDDTERANILTDGEIGKLYEYLSGHPSLMRHAFEYIAGPRRMPFKTFEDTRLLATGPFGPQMIEIDRCIKSKEGLLELYRQLDDMPENPKRGQVYDLMQQGLVRRDRNGRLIPASRLHAEFLNKQIDASKPGTKAR